MTFPSSLKDCKLSSGLLDREDLFLALSCFFIYLTFHTHSMDVRHFLGLLVMIDCRQDLWGEGSGEYFLFCDKSS